MIGAVADWFVDAVIKSTDAAAESKKAAKRDESVADFEKFVRLLSGESVAIGRAAPRGNLQMRVMNFFRPDAREKNAGVSLYTMHSSKGLEFDNVMVIQCNAGTIPSAKSPVEEERRLFYVAMTRARKNLVMSSISSQGPSQFLGELAIS